MKRLTLLSLVLSTLSIPAFAYNVAHCTFENQNADSFFKALIIAHKKLKAQIEIPAPSFKISKNIPMQSFKHIDYDSFLTSQYVKSLRVGDCFVELRIYNPNDKVKMNGYRKGEGRSFANSNPKFSVFKPTYNLYGNTQLFITDKKLGVEIVASELCEASEVVSGLSFLGLQTDFISKKDNKTCY